MADLVSIILVYHNLEEITLQCVRSIYQNTEPPFELIVIDNGSKIQLKEKLEAFPQVRFFRNEKNTGYAAALNSGLKKARGAYYLTLNNDIIATPHWLQNMLRCLKSDPQIGIVGPATNRIGNPRQRIETPEFNSYQELMNFAKKYNRWDSKKWLPFDHTLAGFCMLIRKRVVDRIGPFDEQFQIGLCEDYDFVRRAIKAGFLVMCAHDTFIFHYYNLTFNHLNIHRQSLLENNIKKYKRKWSHES